MGVRIVLPPFLLNGGELVLLWREATEVECERVLLAGEMAGIGCVIGALCERERRRRVSVEWMGSK